MRIRRGVVELGLQRLDLRLQSSHLRLQPCNLLLQGGIAGGLSGALRTPADGLTFAHVPSSGIPTLRLRKAGEPSLLPYYLSSLPL